MMKFKHKFSILLTSVVFVGCQVVDDVVTEPIALDAFTAAIESFDTETKTELIGNYAVWTDGDDIAIFQGNSIADRYVLYDLQSSAFRVSDRAEKGNELSTNVAFYPYSGFMECVEVTGGYRISNVSFPSDQDYKKGSFSEESFLMVAATDELRDRELAFKNICGGIRLRFQSIAGDTVSVRRIVFKGNGGEKLSGNADVIYNTENALPIVEWDADAQESITMEVQDFHLTDSTVAEIVLSVPPQVFPDGFTVEADAQVNGVDSLYIRPTMRPQEIRRSRILTMPVITFGEEIVHPYLSLNKDMIIFESGIGTQTLEVTANNEWSAVVDSDWVSLSPSFGQGTDQAAPVKINVTKNNTYEERTAVVTFTSEYLVKTVTILQQPKTYLDISRYLVDLSYDGGSATVDVRSNYEWEAWADVEWISVSPSYGEGDGNTLSVTITASHNDSKDARSGLVIFSAGSITRVVSVSQRGRGSYIDEYGIDHGNGVKVGETIWAPVNCGYHYTQYKYGKLYQWGRRYGQGYGGNSPQYKSGPVSLSAGQSETNSNVFYTGSSNWCSTFYRELWNSGTESEPVKTENDPCPEGWRIPTYAEFNKLKQTSSNWTINSDGVEGRNFAGADPDTQESVKVFFPASGYRSYNGNSVSSQGSSAYYWTSRPNGTKIYTFKINEQAPGFYNDDYPAYGQPVRCVKDRD